MTMQFTTPEGHLVHGGHIKFTETVQAGAAGEPMCGVTHLVSYEQAEPFSNVWSSRLDLPAMVPTDLTLSALAMPQAPHIIRDLLTGQDLRLIGIHNFGPGLVTVDFFSGADSMLRMTLTDDSHWHLSCDVGELLGQPIDKVSFLALTGEAKLDVLFASQAE